MTQDELNLLPEQLRKAWELCEKATPGPFIVSRSIPCGDEPSRVTIDALRSGGMGEMVAEIKWRRNDDDLRLWAEARTALPAALEHIVKLREELARVYKLVNHWSTTAQTAEATIAELRQNAADDKLAFDHAEEVVGKQEATIERLAPFVQHLRVCSIGVQTKLNGQDWITHGCDCGLDKARAALASTTGGGK